MTLIIILFVLIALGMPISFALGMTGLSFFAERAISLQTFAQRFAVGLDNFGLMAAPFFILAGVIMNRSGITSKIFNFANSIVGPLPGGLGHVNVLASTIFAGMSGTAIADAAGLGPIEIKAMTDHGYDIKFSTAITAASSIIGPIIPPSTVMIMYGITAQVSISKLFLGGIIPGLIIAVAEMALVAFYAHKRHYPRSEHFSWKNLWVTFKDAIWAMITPIIIIGGILGGICTPTEAGALASVYALICGIFVYKTISWKDIPSILWETALTSGVILVIVSTASIFGWCLTFAKVPQTVAAAISAITSHKTVMLLIITAIYLFLGMIMETTAIILTTVPIMLPVVKLLGIDPIYLGVLIAIIMSIGTITPPVGTVLFILSKVTGLSIEELTVELIPWYGLLAIVLLLLIFIPDLVMFIPSLVQ